MQTSITKQTIGATLLVTSSCIGAGMVGLPVVSALAGWMPSTLAMVFAYIFTTFTGLLLLEATLWFDRRVNLTSIAESTFGKAGRWITMALFLFLFYCLFVAYFDAGGQLIAGVLSTTFHTTISVKLGMLVYVAFICTATFAGTRKIDSFNRILLIGLIASYLGLVILGMSHVSSLNLSHVNWTASLATIPILLICFGYQNLVPSLTYYLHKNVRALRIAIIVGNFFPFIVYLLWNTVILGMLNETQIKNLHSADMVTELLQANSHTESVIFLVKSFSLFAVLASCLPSAISFIDFLKDGFRSRNDDTRLPYILLIFIPPLICGMIYPHLFLHALGFAGGFIDVLLFGILPASVVLIGRKKQSQTSSYQVVGGKIVPILVIVFSAIILIIKIS